jgi:hypothetical protein
VLLKASDPFGDRLHRVCPPLTLIAMLRSDEFGRNSTTQFTFEVERVHPLWALVTVPVIL